LVFSVIVVDLIGFGILIPILPFMSPALGGNEMDVAFVIAIYSLCAGIAGPFWGGLSDRIGRKQVLMVCLFGGALSYGMIGVASELWMLYAARAVGGVMAGSLPVASALMADVSAPASTSKGNGSCWHGFWSGAYFRARDWRCSSWPKRHIFMARLVCCCNVLSFGCLSWMAATRRPTKCRSY
jgi:MFS family permease